MRLLDTEDPSGFRLPEAAAFDETVNLQRELCFQQLLFWMGKTKVGKNVPAAFFYPDGFFALVVMSVLPFSMEPFSLGSRNYPTQAKPAWAGHPQNV